MNPMVKEIADSIDKDIFATWDADFKINNNKNLALLNINSEDEYMRKASKKVLEK